MHSMAIREASEAWPDAGTKITTLRLNFLESKQFRYEVAILHHLGVPPVALLLHPYDNVVVIADEQSTLRFGQVSCANNIIKAHFHYLMLMNQSVSSQIEIQLAVVSQHSPWLMKTITICLS